MSLKERTCNKCGWVQFAVTREYAETDIKRFMRMYENLTAGEKERYYGSKIATMKRYETCDYCGNDCKDFHDSEENDCPDGATLSPIIEE